MPPGGVFLIAYRYIQITIGCNLDMPRRAEVVSDDHRTETVRQRDATAIRIAIRKRRLRVDRNHRPDDRYGGGQEEIDHQTFHRCSSGKGFLGCALGFPHPHRRGGGGHRQGTVSCGYTRKLVPIVSVPSRTP